MNPVLQNILYIDDDEDILAIAKIALEKIGGFKITVSSDSIGGIKLAQKIMPDLIMLDVMMSGIDGLTMFKKFRETEYLAAIPIVFMTAKVQSSEIDHYLSLGAAGVISKPFNAVTLPNQIRAFWESCIVNKVTVFPDSLQALREQFLSRLHRKYQDIGLFMARYKEGILTAEDQKKMFYLVHNLSGSGLTYGYPDITQAARAVEKALEAQPCSSDIVVLTNTLLKRISEITGKIVEA